MKRLLYKNPKILFLVDGLGALLSAFFLGFVLIHYQCYFGIPKSSLYFLACFPIMFACFDFYNLRSTKVNVVSSLRVIAGLNSAYALLSLFLASYHFRTITIYGWAYIMIEIVTIATLAFLEIQTAKHLIKSG